MKTFFEKLLVHIECIAHPAGGWFSKQTGSTRKRKAQTAGAPHTISPECYNVRGAKVKKVANHRFTPAP